MSRICFARVDRIGDLILTLPCQAAWLKVRPNDQICWMIPENLDFVAKNAVPPLDFFNLKIPEKFWEKLKNAFALSRRLRDQTFDEIISFHVPWWVALAIWLSGIKKRTGVASQWYSWIFFNRRLRQRRSLAEKNEAHYNLDLISFALGKTPLLLSPTKLQSEKTKTMEWAQKLKKCGVNLNKLVVVHPGMAGSARNWPAESYNELVKQLVGDGVSVTVTGTKIDEEFVKRTRILEITGVLSLVGQLLSDDLLSVLSLAKCVVVPSTGVAHIAASLGVPVVGIYSPVRVQAPKRWAPLGPKVQVLLPNVECPGKFKCLGTACRFYDCMAQITVESLKACVMDKL